MSDSFILTLSCPDRAGIVHAVTGFVGKSSGNITEAAQYNDQSTGLFFARMRFDCPPGAALSTLREQFEPLAESMQMSWGLHSAHDRVPTIIMVSKLGHCLNDLLFRYRTHLLPLEIKAIVSNHRDYYQLAAAADIPFHHIPVTPDNKATAEAKLLDLVKQEGVELVVLARYMQVLSNDLCRALAELR